MPETAQLIDRFRDELTLPEDWDVIPLRGFGSFEISGYDGDEIQSEAIEVIPGDQINELVIQHVDMPGRMAHRTPNQDGGAVLEVPSQAGVLQFETIDDAIRAADELADPDVLEEFTKLRNPMEADASVSVREAIAQTTEIDLETAIGTSAGI